MSSEIEYLKSKVISLENNMAAKSDVALIDQKLDTHISIQSDMVAEMKETNKALREVAESLRIGESEKKHRDKEIESILQTLGEHQKVIGKVEILMHDQVKKDKKWGIVEKVVITAVTGAGLLLLADKLIS